MPPVLGPASPSRARLKSRAGARGTTRSPSLMPKTDSSGPSSRSSTTIVDPAWPKAWRTSMASIASSASRSSAQTRTPLPSARPSALTATRPRSFRAKRRAGSASLNVSKAAVGMSAATITSFANALLLSMRPASRSGPNTGMPASRRASATPAATAASGPRMARPIFSFRASRASRAGSSAGTATLRAMAAVPPLPGATYTRSASGDRRHFHTSACSRAPEPMTRILITLCSLPPCAGGLGWGVRAGSPTPTLPRRGEGIDRSLPLDGSGRLAGHVEHYAVDAAHLVHDPVRDPRQHVVREPRPVGGHRVLGRHHAHRDHVRVRSVVAHHAHGLQRGQHGERLPHLAVQPMLLDLVHDHPVRPAQHLQALGRDLAEASDRETG